MTDAEVNFQGMALNVLKLLGDNRPAWEKLYKKLLPDYTALETALDSFDGKAQQRGATGSKGYTEAKDLAEVAVLDAALPVVQGLKALYQDGEHPALATVAAYSRSGLDDLRGLVQVTALENIHAAALPLAAALAEELQNLRDRTAAYKPLIGTPRQQISSGSVLREDAVKYLGEARAALARLDVRIPNLESALPALVAHYQQARSIVDAGRGAKAAAGPVPPAK